MPKEMNYIFKNGFHMYYCSWIILNVNESLYKSLYYMITEGSTWHHTMRQHKSKIKPHCWQRTLIMHPDLSSCETSLMEKKGFGTLHSSIQPNHNLQPTPRDRNRKMSPSAKKHFLSNKDADAEIRF